MRVVFAGTPDVAVPALEAVAASRHELVGVLSRPDAPAGRGRKLVASPVAQRAAELGVPVLTPERPTDPDFQAELRALAPECCPVVAYGALLPASALAIPTHGWVNLHFSLLPAYRGAAPVQHAIRSGETMTGATTFRIVPELDAGPTFGVMTQEVGPTETAGSLLDTLSRGGAELLVATLDGIEDGTVEAREQPEDGLSYAGKLTAADGEVDWGRSSLAIDRQIRACTPAPGAWTRFEGERFKLGPVTPVDDLPGDSAAPTRGELVVTKKAVFVGTGTTPVRLGNVKPFGKKEMPAADWARGVRVESGATVGG